MDPREANAHHRKRAQAALDIGRYGQAEREARTALSYNPADDESFVLLSRALLGEGSYEKALDAVEQAVRIAPRRGYHHYLAGYALQCLGRYADSIEPLMQAVTLEPGSARYGAPRALRTRSSSAPPRPWPSASARSRWRRATAWCSRAWRACSGPRGSSRAPKRSPASW